MKLVLVALGGGAAFQIADIRALVVDDQGPLELAGVGGIDAEIGGKLHRAADAYGHIDEGAVGKDRAIQGREIIVGLGHDLAQPPLHQLGIFADRSEEHTSELQSLMRISYAVFCLQKKNQMPRN